LSVYEFIRMIGRGGMSVVYLAHNRLMWRDAVLKVIGQPVVEPARVLDRFLREIRAVARLRDPKGRSGGRWNCEGDAPSETGAKTHSEQ
jgi:serine/threonine protein kinase